MIRSTCLCLLIFTTLLSARAEQGIEIATRFEKEKIAALETYLADNPEAPDRDMTLRILTASYTELGEHASVPDLLIQRYELLPKSDEVNFQILIGEITRPLIAASISANQRDKAKAFLTRIKTDYAASPASAQLTSILDDVGSDLYLPGVGDAMEMAFTDLNGNDVDLAAWKGKVILIDFWATWCAPCIAALPHLKQTYEQFHESGFEVIGVCSDERKEELEAFIAARGIPWPQYFDGQGIENEFAQRYGIKRLPSTFLVGKDGKIVAANLHGAALTQAIEEEIAK